jgi:hypothetical protein
MMRQAEDKNVRILSTYEVRCYREGGYEMSRCTAHDTFSTFCKRQGPELYPFEIRIGAVYQRLTVKDFLFLGREFLQDAISFFSRHPHGKSWFYILYKTMIL